MRPTLTLVGGTREPVAHDPGHFSFPRPREPFPIGSLVWGALFGPMRRPDANLLLESLGSLDRWDVAACRIIEDEIRARSYRHPDFNEEFVVDRLSRVGGEGSFGRIARARWIANGLDRYASDVRDTYRHRGAALVPVYASYLRALYVSCVSRRMPGAY